MPVTDGVPEDAFGEPGQPSDPGAVSATSIGPEPSSEAPAQPTEPQAVADVDAGSDEPQEPLPEFDERHRKAFEGLLFLGKLEKTFTWAGHEFRIKTLTVDEILEVGLLQQPYIGSFGEIKAYQAACIAACLQSLDGRPISIPIDDQVGILQSRFDYIKTHWFPPVLDAIYQEYLLLESTVQEILEAMGKA